MPKPTDTRLFVNVTPFDAQSRSPLMAAIKWHVMTYIGEGAKVSRCHRQVRITLPSTGQRWIATIPVFAVEAEQVLKVTTHMSGNVRKFIGLYGGFGFPLTFVGRN